MDYFYPLYRIKMHKYLASFLSACDLRYGLSDGCAQDEGLSVGEPYASRFAGDGSELSFESVRWVQDHAYLVPDVFFKHVKYGYW